MPTYHEAGLIAEVEVLKDLSNDDLEVYKLKVLEIKQESSIYRSPEIGQVFDVLKIKGEGSQMADWHLFGNE